MEFLPHGRPKIWGGIECTINRIGDEYKDQLKYSGHYDRPGDLEAIAELGIKTLRYPILWEKHQIKRDTKIDWLWTDRQMNSLRALEIKPIAGLLHHGSGPSFTSLLDPEFPYLLSQFAYEVASRYPWIEDYTPVNEPLTTARFSGLYGLWYPHHTTEISFYRMLLNQLMGVVLSMEAIHSINPQARLIQTEDLGKTYSTPKLEYQAKFENDRRLLTFDILTGALKPGHPQYNYMLGCGINKGEIDFFQKHQATPDIMGLNYYVTSERWLDESQEKYLHHTHGGNGIHQYADTELVRAKGNAEGGFQKLATEVWERYHIPMAVTESHLHCTREEQLRWFKEIWDDAIKLSSAGIEILGVTAWALLGSFDWDSLLTKTGTQYESGVFDIKSFTDKLRPTALTTLIKTLIEGKSDFHPVLSAPGWWHESLMKSTTKSKPILIIREDTGAQINEIKISEMVAKLISACNMRRIHIVVKNSPDELRVQQLDPWAVINLANADEKLKSFCEIREIHYITFNKEKPGPKDLNIFIEKTSVSIHQINKLLDLMIDGDKGTWFFGSDGVNFKTDDLIFSQSR